MIACLPMIQQERVLPADAWQVPIHHAKGKFDLGRVGTILARKPGYPLKSSLDYFYFVVHPTHPFVRPGTYLHAQTDGSGLRGVRPG